MSIARVGRTAARHSAGFRAARQRIGLIQVPLPLPANHLRPALIKKLDTRKLAKKILMGRKAPAAGTMGANPVVGARLARAQAQPLTPLFESRQVGRTRKRKAKKNKAAVKLVDRRKAWEGAKDRATWGRRGSSSK